MTSAMWAGVVALILVIAGYAPVKSLVVHRLQWLTDREWAALVTIAGGLVLALALLIRLTYLNSPPELQIYGRF